MTDKRYIGLLVKPHSAHYLGNDQKQANILVDLDMSGKSYAVFTILLFVAIGVLKVPPLKISKTKNHPSMKISSQKHISFVSIVCVFCFRVWFVPRDITMTTFV